MQISFSIDENDFLAFSNYYYGNTAEGRAGMHRMYIVGAVLFIFFAYSEYDDPVYGAQNPMFYGAYLLVSAGLLGILYFAYIQWLRPAIIRRAALGSGMRKTLGEQELAWDVDTITITTPEGRGKIKWSDVQGIADDKQHFYLILGSLRAFIVPKRVFSSEGETRQFWGDISTNFERATHEDARS